MLAVELLSDIGHHIPRRGAREAAARIIQFLAVLENRPTPAYNMRTGVAQIGHVAGSQIVPAQVTYAWN